MIQTLFVVDETSTQNASLHIWTFGHLDMRRYPSQAMTMTNHFKALKLMSQQKHNFITEIQNGKADNFNKLLTIP